VAEYAGKGSKAESVVWLCRIDRGAGSGAEFVPELVGLLVGFDDGGSSSGFAEPCSLCLLRRNHLGCRGYE
jgi:hypothetical protein